jgi:xanthine dehydrogenase accessory factor
VTSSPLDISPVALANSASPTPQATAIERIAAFAPTAKTGLLVRVVRLEGFGGRRDGEVLLLNSTASIGELFGGLFAGRPGELLHHDMAAPATVELPIGDVDAVAAGLACGGMAEVVVQQIQDLPTTIWESVRTRNDVAIATELFGNFRTIALTKHELVVSSSASSEDELVAMCTDHLQKSRTRTAVIADSQGRRVFLETLQPTARIAVIGASQLANALVAQAKLLGWSGEVVDERTSPERCTLAAADLGGVDALMVLSHDIALSCAAMAAALRNGCGYVGALGSRHTQTARSEYLLGTLSVSTSDLDRVYGPIGLNIGARTPEETAVAIFAEVLANRSGRSASSLRGTSGPING